MQGKPLHHLGDSGPKIHKITKRKKDIQVYVSLEDYVKVEKAYRRVEKYQTNLNRKYNGLDIAYHLIDPEEYLTKSNEVKQSPLQFCRAVNSLAEKIKGESLEDKITYVADSMDGLSKIKHLYHQASIGVNIPITNLITKVDSFIAYVNSGFIQS